MLQILLFWKVTYSIETSLGFSAFFNKVKISQGTSRLVVDLVTVLFAVHQQHWRKNGISQLAL